MAKMKWKSSEVVEVAVPVEKPEKPKKPKVDLVAKKRKAEREELAIKMRASDLTVDEKRAMVREFNEK